VTKRGQRIEALEFGAVGESDTKPAAKSPDEPSVGTRTGQLRLRVVDGDE
jgi:DNA recombination protein RmuC